MPVAGSARAGDHVPGDGVGCRQVLDRCRAVPGAEQSWDAGAAVQAAEHVQQRGGYRDGGEIGRAQALQAMACRVAPTVDMNPVLLKPQSDVGSQVVVLGRVAGNASAQGFQQRKAALLDTVLASFARLGAAADIVLVEGAGSAAEVNLRASDIANMGFARAADVPVIVVGDIDRGGVIAQIVGTRCVVDEADAALVRGFHRQQVSRRSGAVSVKDWNLSRPVPAGTTLVWCRTSATPGCCRRKMRWRWISGRPRARGQRLWLRCLGSRTSPTSTNSIRCGWSHRCGL